RRIHRRPQDSRGLRRHTHRHVWSGPLTPSAPALVRPPLELLQYADRRRVIERQVLHEQDAAYAGLRIHPELGIEDACPAVAARTTQAWVAGALSHLHRHAEGVAPRADRKLLAESGYRGGL